MGMVAIIHANQSGCGPNARRQHPATTSKCMVSFARQQSMLYHCKIWPQSKTTALVGSPGWGSFHTQSLPGMREKFTKCRLNGGTSSATLVQY